MSTVLWANYLSAGIVTSDQSDKQALNKQLEKLDEICQSSGLPLLSSLCDSTDIQFNLEDIELPDGIESTDQLMAQQGVWIDAADAVRLLECLLQAINEQQTRFGLLRNDHDAVVSELTESLAFAKLAAGKDAQFNFSIVM